MLGRVGRVIDPTSGLANRDRFTFWHECARIALTGKCKEKGRMDSHPEHKSGEETLGSEGQRSRKPTQIQLLASRVLDALAGKPEASEIVLGGYLALQHFVDYRKTNDIDAWWRTRATKAAEAAIREAMGQVASSEGYELRERRFGDTLSFELCRDGRKSFSFQIAVRSVEIEPPVASAWPPLLIETLRDNVGSKMNALVDRGAPRDFLDIKHVVTADLASSADCWALWLKKNPGDSADAAREKVLHHLTALELRRPLEHIPDLQERERARETREWFRRDFLGPLR